MVKRTMGIAFLLSVTVLAGCASLGKMMVKPYTKLKERSPLLGALRKHVAVIEFHDQTGRRLGRLAADAIIIDLARSQQFILLEREKIAGGLTSSLRGKQLDVAELSMIGEEIEADMVITGSLIEFDMGTPSPDWVSQQMDIDVKDYTRYYVSMEIVAVDAKTKEEVFRKKVNSASGGALMASQGEVIKTAVDKVADELIDSILSSK